MLFDFRTASENSDFLNSDDEACSSPASSSLSELRKLTDAELGESTLRAAKDEKLATKRLLEHLCEVERRFLFADWGFSSLHDYVERGLGYLGSAANERVLAARFLKRVPAVKKALTSGVHTLTSVAMIGRHVKREELSRSEASRLLEQCEEKSSREIERILVEGSTQVTPVPEKVRAVSAELTRLTLEVDAEFMALVDRMKELRGNSGATLSELFRFAMIEFTKKREIKMKRNGESPVMPPENLTKAHQKLRAPVPDLSNGGPSGTEKPKARIRTRYIPVSGRKRVRLRALDQCEYVDPVSKRRCIGRTGLEFDHFPVPFARGGESTAENLRYVCRTHNTLHAVQSYGARMMGAFRKN
jgi:hypothetical protein